MSTDLSTLEKLRRFDPEFGATSADDSARDRLLNRLVAEDFDGSAERSVESARRPSRKAALGLVAAVAAGTAGVLLFALTTVTPHSDFAAGQHFSLASWTKTPSPAEVSPTETAACAKFLDPDSGGAAESSASAVDRRGDFVSFVVSGGSDGFCVIRDSQVVFAAPTEALAPSTSLAPDEARVDLSGFATDSGDDSAVSRAASDAPVIPFVMGVAGDDVIAVTIDLDGVTRVEATIADGEWTAWWPATPETTAGAEPVIMPLGVTYTTSDGKVHEAPFPVTSDLSSLSWLAAGKDAG